jgi:hypothetical protein
VKRGLGNVKYATLRTKFRPQENLYTTEIGGERKWKKLVSCPVLTSTL